ncbi:Hypothetical protein RAK1035_2263 [Roseovarius sp. AK1035]|nr:Hypothetical protein RAK1035_2263 [Roseovarius sp. AK1035]
MCVLLLLLPRLGPKGQEHRTIPCKAPPTAVTSAGLNSASKGLD